MKRYFCILSALLYLLWAWSAWGADQVAAVDVAGTSIKYKAGNHSNCSDASGWTEGGDLEAALAAASGDDLYICDGSYTGTMLDSDSQIELQANNQQIIGQSRTGTILQTDATHAVIDDNTRTGCWIKSLTVQHTDATAASAAYLINGTSGQINTQDVKFLDGGRIFGNGNTTVSHINPWIVNHIGSGRGFSNTGAAGVQNIYNMIVDGTNKWLIYQESTATDNVYGGVIIGSRDQVVRLGPTSVVNFYNVIAAGNMWETANPASNGLGTFTAYYCDLLPSVIDPADRDFAAEVENNVISLPPQFVSPRREAFVSLLMDDSNNWDDWKDMADYANSKGFPAAFSLHAPRDFTDWAEAATYHAAGNEILCHGQTAKDWGNLTNGITIDGPAGSTITPAITQTGRDGSAWSGTLTLNDGADHVITVNWTKTLTQLAAEINALDGWTASVHADAEGDTPSVCVADDVIADADTATMGFDQDRFWHWIAVQAKIDIETEMRAATGDAAYECKFIVPTGATTDQADFRAFVSDASKYPSSTNPFIGMRWSDGSYTMASDLVTHRDGATAGLDVFDIRRFHLVANYINSSSVEPAIASRLVFMAWAGGYDIYLSHGYSYPGDTFPEASWEALIDTVAKMEGVQVMTPSQVVEHITGSGLYTETGAGTDVWVRTYADNADYRIQGDSPLRDAGADLGDAYDEDIDGEDQDRYGRGWEIGVNVYKEVSSFGVGF